MKFFSNLKFYVKIIPPRHIKYKVIDFFPSIKSIMANKLALTNDF